MIVLTHWQPGRVEARGRADDWRALYHDLRGERPATLSPRPNTPLELRILRAAQTPTATVTFTDAEWAGISPHIRG